MSTAAPLTWRPLACCVRMASSRSIRRFASSSSVASLAKPAVPVTFHSIPTSDGRVRTAFAVYGPPPPPSAAPAATSPSAPPLPRPASLPSAAATTTATTASKTPKVDVLRAYHQQQIALLDPTGARTHLFSRKNPDSAKPGDVLLVTPAKAGGESFAGVCLSVRRAGIETAILLRGQLAKTGVEMWFKVYSRAVAAIDIIQRRPKRARRARLTYMRQPKHDRGSVDDLVKAWRRSRNVMRTRGGGAKATKPA